MLKDSFGLEEKCAVRCSLEKKYANHKDSLSLVKKKKKSFKERCTRKIKNKNEKDLALLISDKIYFKQWTKQREIFYIDKS